MNAKNCYADKVLRVDLSSGTATTEALSETWASSWSIGPMAMFELIVELLR